MASSSSKALATLYRPQTLDEIVEQEAVVKILKNQIKNKTFRNTALFCGPAGTGKTTCARAFAREINKGKGNPIEIDAASNNGVENIRDITAKAQQKALDCEYKVFIIDETHALTNAAWQAFLKTLEEPPANTIFVFCTTDPQKIPKTILSRVQRFEFKRISFDGIVNRLKWIVTQEDYNWAKQNLSSEELDKYDAMGAEFKYTYDENALQLIAKMAEGGMRDAITMLDKVMSLNDKITVESVVRSLGSADYKVFFALTNSIIDCKEDNVIDIIESIYNDGADLKQFIKQYLMFLLDVNKYAIFKNFKYVQIPDIYEKEIKAVVEGVDLKFLKYLLDQINTLNNDIRWEAQVKPIVEMKLLVLSRDDA